MLVSLQASAQERDFSKVEIKVTKVAGNVYMLQGMGGNIAALVGEDGIAIVDDQFEPLAEKIAKALSTLGITKKQVGYVINTHYHGDHTGGNAAFSKTATIIAHENVRNRLKEGSSTGNGMSLQMKSAASPKEGLPVITFEDKLKVHLNGEEIQAIHFPSAHTDTDSVIFFKNANVVHMGDQFVAGFPFIDVLGGGSLLGLTKNIERIIQRLPANVKIIPGHGPLSNLDDLKEFLKMLKDSQAVVKKSYDAGKTIDEMKAMGLLDPWSEKYGKGFINADRYLETIFVSLGGKKK